MAVHPSRTMVGRDAELTELADLLGTGPEGGEPGIVLLAGDAGVGKTRLLMALRDRAVAAGWRVDAGNCLDFGDAALPYLPFSEVLGRLGEQLPGLVDEVAAVHPALGRLRPGRRTRGGVSGEPLDPPAADRGELFEAVHALLERVAAEAPLLLVIEDLHWADRSTRDLLGFLFGRRFEQPVAIVASYRSDDLHRRHPLRPQVAEWARVHGVRRLALAPLADAAVRALVGQLAPEAMAEADLAAIVRRADGNAFFVEELVSSGGSGWVPDDLADLLLVRLDQLSEDARLVVRVASVAGRKVTHELLAAAAGLEPARLDAGIRLAVERHVLVAGRRSYSFRHALLGEAVHDDLLPGERVRLHQAYATALVDGTASGTAAELAHHARRAMDLDRAVVAGLEAGAEAMAVGGADEAARHFDQVLELLVDPDRVARLDVDLGQVVVNAAGSHAVSGDPQRAVALLRDHLGRLPADAPGRWRARMLGHYALMLLITEHEEDVVAVSREAVRLAPAGEDAVRAKVLSTHAHVLVAVVRSEGRNVAPALREEARAVATEALALSERLDLPAVASEVATSLGMLPEEAAATGPTAALEAAVAQAVAVGATEAELRARYLLARAHQDAGAWEEAEQWFASAMARGLEAGLPWAPYSLESRYQRAVVADARGEWDTVLSLTAIVDDGDAPPIPGAMLRAARLPVLAARGRDVDAQFDELRAAWADEGLVAVQAAGPQMEFHGRHRDPAAVVATYDDVVAVLGRYWHEHFGARVRLAAQAIDGVARGVPTAGAALRERLATDVDRLHADGRAVVERFASADLWAVEGQAWTQRLEAEWLRARWLLGTASPERAELLAAWDATVSRFADYGHVPETARVQATYADVLRQVGDAAAARDLADAARATAHRLGWTLLLADLGESGARPRRQATAPTELTPREREILGLVAEGRTNGEVGKQLFISTKTVSVHVSRILAKLGAASRTEAAAIAHREGLLG